MSEIVTDSPQPGAEAITESQAQGAAEPVAGEDLEGLKSNRDALLLEKRQLAAQNKKIQQELDNLKAAQDASAKKALLEQEKFKEMYELTLKEKETLQTQISEKDKKSKFKDAAILEGVQPKYLKFVLADIDQIDFDENGDPTNIDAFFANYKQAYPQFFNPENGVLKPVIPKTDSAVTNLTGTQPAPITREWIKKMQEKIPTMTIEEYKQFKDKINTAREAGLIQ